MRSSSLLRFFTSCLAVVGLVLLAAPSAAQSADGAADERIHTVIAELDQALLDFDFDAVKRLLAPKFSYLSRPCSGAPAERKTAEEFVGDLQAVASMGPAQYERERSQVEVTLLGGGPIGVYRSEVSEYFEWPSGSLRGKASEQYFLDEIGGRYLITSINSQSHCDSVEITGTLPAPSDG